MTLESDTKFGENLASGFKNDMKILVNFNASSGKFESLYFDVILLSIAYKISAKKVQKSYLSWHRKVIQTLKKNSLSCLKNDMRNLINLSLSSEKSKIWILMGLFYQKYVMLELK